MKTTHPVELPLKDLFWGMPMKLIKKYGSIEKLRSIGYNSTCNKRLHQIALSANIDKRLHWHLARHTCATLLNMQGLKMHEIQKILGHQRLSTTSRIYAHTTLDQIKNSLSLSFTESNKKKLIKESE